jgi:hypothetical protein
MANTIVIGSNNSLSLWVQTLLKVPDKIASIWSFNFEFTTKYLHVLVEILQNVKCFGYIQSSSEKYDGFKSVSCVEKTLLIK